MARKVIYTDADGDEFFVTTTAPNGAYRPSTDVAVSVLLPKNPEAIDGLLTEFAAALGREPCDGGFRELRRMASNGDDGDTAPPCVD